MPSEEDQLVKVNEAIVDLSKHMITAALAGIAP
jgi:hypothetical protein